MGPAKILERLRSWIGSRAFRMFIWANRTTNEKYWREVYEIEKAYIARADRD